MSGLAWDLQYVASLVSPTGSGVDGIAQSAFDGIDVAGIYGKFGPEDDGWREELAVDIRKMSNDVAAYRNMYKPNPGWDRIKPIYSFMKRAELASDSRRDAGFIGDQVSPDDRAFRAKAITLIEDNFSRRLDQIRAREL